MIQNSPSEKGSQNGSVRAPMEKVWEFEAERDIIHSVVARGMVFFVTERTSRPDAYVQQIYALDATSGQERWMFEIMDEEVRRPLVVADGILYIFGNLHHHKGKEDRNLHAIDAQTGEKRWQFSIATSMGFRESLRLSMFLDNTIHIWLPIVTNGVVYVVSDDKILHAINAQTGLERWRFSTGEDIGFPIVGRDMIFFGSKDKRVYALDSDSGEKKWEFESGHKNHCRPTVTDDKVLIAGHDDLYALDANSGTLLWKIKKALQGGGGLVYDYGNPPIVVGNAVICPKELTVVDLANGVEKGKLAPKQKYIMRARFEKKKGIRYMVNNQGFHVENGILYMPVGGTLYAIDLATAELKWYTIIDPGWRANFAGWTVTEEFLFATIRSSMITHCVNISRPMKHWEFPEPGSVPIIAGEMAFIYKSKKMYGYESSKDPVAQSVLEIGEKVVSFPFYTASVLLPKERFGNWSGQIVWPNCCCLCCGSVEKHIDLEKVKKVGGGWSQRLSASGVPYCENCLEKTRARKVRGRWGWQKAEKTEEPESPGVEILLATANLPTFAFRNGKYCTMFMKANRLR